MEATLWTVRLAALCYAAALWLRLRGKAALARRLWVAGFVLYAAHVFSAFQWIHDWSHGRAYEETARQTKALFGMDWGGGLYFNYAFTLLWLADVIWNWQDRRLRSAVDGFLFFMFVNGVVVFGHGWTRWIGVGFLAAYGMALVWRRGRYDASLTDAGPR